MGHDWQQFDEHMEDMKRRDEEGRKQRRQEQEDRRRNAVGCARVFLIVAGLMTVGVMAVTNWEDLVEKPAAIAVLGAYWGIAALLFKRAM